MADEQVKQWYDSYHELSRATYLGIGKDRTRISGHDIGLGRDQFQIKVYVNGHRMYFKSWERALEEIQKKLAATNMEALLTLESIVEAEAASLETIREIAKDIKEYQKGCKCHGRPDTNGTD